MKQDWQVRARSQRSWRIDIAYDPLNTDLLYYVTREGFEPCQIMAASAAFAHRSWHEVKDYFAGSAQLKDRSLTRELQSKTDRNAQIAAIVQGAIQRADAVEKPETKAAALRDIRANRKIERYRERADAAIERRSALESSTNGIATEAVEMEADDETGYVARPTNFAELRAQRELHQSKL
jgi:hypothetical protein